MTNEQKVRIKYPDADYKMQRMLGATFYVIVTEPYSSWVVGTSIGSLSKAWTDARKNIEAGKQLSRL